MNAATVPEEDEPARIPHPARHGYFARGAAAAVERDRQELFATLTDPITHRRLAPLLSPGARCLEIGAGTGSIARWMADRVGPKGAVIATDLDPARVEELRGHPNLEARRHDLEMDALDAAAFDVVHCRLVLMHTADPRAALVRMAAALRPGGVLCVEEGDFGGFGAVDRGTPEAAQFDLAHQEVCAALNRHGAFDPYLGRRILGELRNLGLVGVQGDGTTWVSRGGDAGARYLALSIELAADRLVAWGGLDSHARAMFARLLADPGFAFVHTTLFGAWARRAPGSA